MRNSKHFFRNLKEQKTKIRMITAYDYAQALMADKAGMHSLLIGDSLANVMLGMNRTIEVGMEEMLIFAKAVAKGAKNAHLVADMPWKSDHSVEKAVQNAKLFIAAGAHSVKVEGEKYAQIEGILAAGIPVVGHLGLTPQTARSLAQVGQTQVEADRVVEAAKHLEALGISALVVEHIPARLGALLTQTLSTPVIGIGAGKETDGQVLVLHDALGLFEGSVPPIAKKFGHLFEEGVKALEEYSRWVDTKEF